MKNKTEKTELKELIEGTIVQWEIQNEILILKNSNDKYAAFQLLDVGNKEFVQKRDNLKINI